MQFGVCGRRGERQSTDGQRQQVLFGHESVATTQIYVHADLALKERALARTTPIDAVPGRYQPSDTIIAFLDNL